MRNKLRAAALLLAVAVAGSGLALAQDGYHYYDRDKGYDNHYGYNDSGLRIAVAPATMTGRAWLTMTSPTTSPFTLTRVASIRTRTTVIIASTETSTTTARNTREDTAQAMRQRSAGSRKDADFRAAVKSFA